MFFRFLGLAESYGESKGREIEVLPPEADVGEGRRRRRQTQHRPRSQKKSLISPSGMGPRL